MLNEIYIKIEGLNLSRISEKLIASGVMMSNFKMKKSYMLFSINERYLPKLKQILKRERKSFYVLKNTPIKRFFAKIPYFIGTFSAFLMLFAFFYVINGIVFSINISASEGVTYDYEKVVNVLSNNNIIIGSKKSNFSAKEIEKLITENLTNISGCEVFFEGRNLNIVLIPAKEKYEEIEGDLLSKYNAVITKIATHVGEPNVKVGDLVLAGDVLIKNSGGAAGEVLGKVYFSSTRIYNEKQNVFKETGQVFKTCGYNLANLITLSNGEECEFKNYKLEKTSEVVVKNLVVPVIKENYIYKEVVIAEEIISFETVEDQIKEELKKETLAKLPIGIETQNISYSVVRDGDMVRIDCFAEVEISLI